MKIIILNKEFEGPYLNLNDIKTKGGVFVVVTDSYGLTPCRILDTGESGNIRVMLSKHRREKNWKKNSEGYPKFLAYYESSNNLRKQLKNQIKREFNPICTYS